jgi:crotonobetainyl-CoA:carnitine CoA-transferase CaiB-like acyl-CoA transferase
MFNHVFVNDPPPLSPEFGVLQRPYRTRNGHVAAMTPQPDEFAALCRGLGRPDLAGDPRFAHIDARRRNVAELLTLLDGLIADEDTDALVARLRAEGVPIGRVNLRAQVLARSATRCIGVDAPPLRPAPQLGEHGRELLGELGLEAARIDALLGAP